MTDHYSQAAGFEATLATGKGKRFLVNEARLMSEGLEQHPWDPASISLQKRENEQALKGDALERARRALERGHQPLEQARQSLDRSYETLKQARQALELGNEPLNRARQALQRAHLALLQQQERIQLEEACLAQLREAEWKRRRSSCRKLVALK